jgi:hypothetical protein
MARKEKRRRKQRRGFERCFTDGDLAWLAEEYKRRIELQPGVTLEEFALRHGIPPEWIRRFIDQSDHPILVWHGTTADRAKAIQSDGFKAPRDKGRIWFTRNAAEARQIAKARAAQRGSEPVVFCCNVNLGQYSDIERPNPNWYVFKQARMDKTVIRSVTGVEKHSEEKPPRQKEKRKDERVDVAIINTSGKLGVLCWVNTYLEQVGKAAVDATHPGVEAIFRWVDTQYASGREELISEAEMLEQVNAHFTEIEGGVPNSESFTS